MKNLKHMLMIVLIMYWPAQSLAQPTGAAFAGWGFNPTRELVASAESAWVTSNPPYLAMPAVDYMPPAIVVASNAAYQDGDNTLSWKEMTNFKVKKEKGYSKVFSWCQDVYPFLNRQNMLEVLDPVLKSLYQNYDSYKPYLGLSKSVVDSIHISMLNPPQKGVIEDITAIEDSRYTNAKTKKKLNLSDISLDQTILSYRYTGNLEMRSYEDKDGWLKLPGEKDSVTFLVEINGKKYKEVVNLWIDENGGNAGMDIEDSIGYKCITKKYKVSSATVVEAISARRADSLAVRRINENTNNHTQYGAP